MNRVSGFLCVLASLWSLTTAGAQSTGERVLVFVADGMRQDYMKEFAGSGKMPAYERLLKTGVDAGDGMIPPLPPNSGVAWTTLATGASPATTGITGNSFHDNNLPFTAFGMSAWAAGANKAETIAEAAEKAGLKVAALGWQTLQKSTIENGIVIDASPTWLTARGVVANYDVPLQYADIRNPIDEYLTLGRVQLINATGWDNTPPSFSPAREAALSMRCVVCTPASFLTFHVFIFDSTDDGLTNYDQVLVSPRKDGSGEVARLRTGEWSGSIKAAVATYQQGGFYIKILDLEPDLRRFRLYFTPLTRIEAAPESLENDLVERFDAVAPDDYGPFIAGLIDARTYIEQTLRHAQTLSSQIYPYVLKTSRPDLVLAGLGVTDSVQHRMLAWAVPGNELYDPVNASTYWRYIQQSYAATDFMLAALWAEMPSANVFAASDHGMTVSGKVVNANYLLETIGLFDRRNLSASKAVAYGSGGLTLVHINLAGRNPGGVVRPEDFANTRKQIVDAFNKLGPSVIDRILLKEETGAVDTLGFKWNIMHPDRMGDVLVFARPPYQYAAPVDDKILAALPFMAGQHGYMPQGDADGFAAFAAAGPRIAAGVKVDRPTALDLAPAVALILGIKPPAQSEGRRAPYVK
jgi:hypothetical protein